MEKNLGRVTGKSAYETAVSSGYIGTEAQWLTSLKGPQGNPGAQGVQGSKGDKGETGSQGPIGLTGPTGPVGEAGPVGPKGDTGNTGAKGDTGIAGPKGDTGDTGPAGPQGIQGIAGDTGPKGDKGDPGDPASYTHPETHPASIITQDASNRFVTDTEKTAWNASEGNAKTYADGLVANLGSTMNKEIYRDISRLNLELAASKLVTSGSTFGVDGSGPNFGMNIDFFRAKSTAALTVGATTITLDTVTGLTVGMEVTIFDDVNLERKTITAINTTTKVITVSALTKAFKAQVNVARTMLVYDLIKQALGFSGWNWTQQVDQTDKTVVASAYQTQASARPVRLSNGWLIATVVEEAQRIVFYKSMDNGTTWTQIAFRNATFSGAKVSVASFGTMVYVLFIFPSATPTIFMKFDATTVSNATSLPSVTIDDQTAYGNVSLAINETGTELNAAWASKNSTYPNSWNIRYAKGIISADGSISWGAVVQVTAFNAANANVNNPTIVVDSQGIPHIFAELLEASVYRLFYTTKKFTTKSWNSGDSAWGNNYIYTGASYAQSSPSAMFVPQSVNGSANGKIKVEWVHTRNGDSNLIGYSETPDGGLTWTTNDPLTGVIAYAFTQTEDKNGNHYVLYHDNGNNIYKAKKLATGWTTPILVKGGGGNTNPSALYDPTFIFTEPLFIYRGSAKVGFYGTWDNQNVSPLLENDIRFTTADAKEVVAWVEHATGLTVDATVNATAMSKTAVNANEDRLLGTLASKLPVTVNVKVKRATTSADDKVPKIIGGIG